MVLHCVKRSCTAKSCLQEGSEPLITIHRFFSRSLICWIFLMFRIIIQRVLLLLHANKWHPDYINRECAPSFCIDFGWLGQWSRRTKSELWSPMVCYDFRMHSRWTRVGGWIPVQFQRLCAFECNSSLVLNSLKNTSGLLHCLKKVAIHLKSNKQ